MSDVTQASPGSGFRVPANTSDERDCHFNLVAMDKGGKNLSISLEEASRVFNDLDSFKKELEANFGKENLVFDPCERYQSLEDVFNESGTPRSYKDAPEEYEAVMQAFYDIMVTTKAMNGGKKMDIYNRDITRHYPVFACNGTPSSFAFGASRYVHARADVGNGSRLAFFESEHAKHAAKIIGDRYRVFLESVKYLKIYGKE